MGNSPSKNNAAPSSSSNAGNLANSGSASSTTTTVANSEPEPDDRKFPSYINHQHSSLTKTGTTPLKASSGQKTGSSGPGLKYKNKLQKKVPTSNTASRHFNYVVENNNSSDDTFDETATEAFDREIDVSLAETLSSTSLTASRPINTKNASNTVTDTEVSSSFSDLFTIGSSTSSSLSISPNFNNLPPIIEEPKKSISSSSLHHQTSHTQRPRRKHGFDVDSIIERLLNVNNRSNNTSPILQGRSSPNAPSTEFFISPKEIATICSKAREIFLDQPSLLRLSAPVKVVGDIHGQFNDLLRILKLSGLPPYSNYLFLGDYVDRGKQSLETILLMLCFKIKYPENFFMLRGNHESANVSKIYGFYDECKRRLNVKSWKLFVDVFNTLPIAAIISDKIFCVHGGLSPNLNSLQEIESIQRPTDIPESGLLADLLWSDPDPSVQDWSESDRGVSYVFGKRVVDSFAKKFKFDLIIRGHMVVEDGYEFFARKKLVTVFSAPNYCGEFNNWGAVMSVDTGLLCSFELLKPNKKLVHH